MAVGFSREYLAGRLRAFTPDLVGISLMSFMYHNSYDIVRFAKEHLPGIKVVAGGPHVSTLRKELLDQCKEIDYGVVLDGEEPMLDLCGGRDLEEIGGLIYRRDLEVVFNGTRPVEKRLDKHPFPRYGGFALDKYVTEEIGIVTSRGCPFLCNYCPVGTSIGRKYRIRNAESIVEEIGYWYEKGYRQFSILDDVFNLDKARVLNICEKIIDSGLSNLELNCNNGIRADKVDREMLTRMYEAGFRYLAFGVEAGNDRILKNIKKGESIEEIEDAIRTAIELNFRVTLFFLIGSSGETLGDVRDSIALAKRHRIFDARFYNLVPFPASEFFEWIKEHDYFLKDPDEYLNNSSHWDDSPVFATPEFTLDDRHRAIKLARAARKEIRYRSMKRALKKRFGPAAGAIARFYINEWFQGKLMTNRLLRRSLKRIFMRAT
jgi:radical SAM superfamily enzyme YgiQ (UPF0313 family)